MIPRKQGSHAVNAGFAKEQDRDENGRFAGGGGSAGAAISSTGQTINSGDMVEHSASGVSGPAQIGSTANGDPYVSVDSGNGTRAGGPASGFVHK